MTPSEPTTTAVLRAIPASSALLRRLSSTAGGQGGEGTTAWVTGAGTGIGEAGALALARAGAAVVLTGRREEPLRRVAAAIEAAGGRALVEPGDMTDPAQIDRIVAAIRERLGRIDVLVNNAGVNIRERRWAELDPPRIDTVIDGNLSSAFYVSAAVLPLMRAQKDGVLIHTASWAGRYISSMSGPAYTAAKHAVVAMSHTINIEEFDNGIRSSVICPGEVATRPKRVCINEVLIGPAWNRSYLRMRG